MTEKTANSYPEQYVPAPEGASSRCGLFGDGTKWAVLMNENHSYRLQENDLSGLDAQKLMTGKYLGRDVILTISSGDLAGRIESLNLALF